MVTMTTRFCWRLYYYVLLGLLSSCDVWGFNIDITTALIQHGPAGSLFGYSVAQHRNKRANCNDLDDPDCDQWLLVGAPKANTTQVDVVEGGAVYKCKVRQSSCEQMYFDTRGSNIKYVKQSGTFKQSDEKSHQWFGASLYSTGSDGVIAACAPLYVHYTKSLTRREPVGTCYLTKDNGNTFEDFSPCRDEFPGLIKDRVLPVNHTDTDPDPLCDIEGHCQAGSSLTFTNDGSKIVVGAPGSYYWQGQVYIKNLNRDYVDFSVEQNTTYDHSYMGWALAMGDYDSDGVQDIAVSIPRLDYATGRVSMFTDDMMTPIANVSGSQIGEYFGYAICSGDFNHDGRTDLVVGAPIYSEYTGDFYEIGRVYVYTQKPDGVFNLQTTLQGSKIRQGRFGTALTSLDDVNNDKYHDLAVGAPYDGEDGRGAVYIFHGSEYGLRSKVSQVIYARQLDSAMSGFGISLSGGSDQDYNNYPDLLVGAYGSNQAVFLRARPVVRVTADITTDPDVVDLEDLSCTLNDHTPVACFEMKTCVTYTGKRAPLSLDFDLTWELEADRSAFLTSTNEKSIKLQIRVEKCVKAKVYIMPKIKDKFAAIRMAATYDMQLPPPRDKIPQPVLDQYSSQTVTQQVDTLKNCSRNNVCIPDLTVSVESVQDEYLMGSGEEIQIEVHIINTGDDAYEARLVMQMPLELMLVNVDKLAGGSKVKCHTGADDKDKDELDKEVNTGIVNCELGNPLHAGQAVGLLLRAVAADNVDLPSHLTFLVQANSTNPDNATDQHDNFAEVGIRVTAEANLVISGVSTPDQILYDIEELANVTEDYIGPELTHLYELQNSGPSPVKLAHVRVYWPSKDSEGRDLLHLTDTPQVTKGQGQCSVVSSNRYIRAVREPRGQSDGSYKEIFCRNDMSMCSTIMCELGPMAARDTVLISIKSTVAMRTVIQIQDEYSGGVMVASEALAEVKQMPFQGSPEDLSTARVSVESYVTTSKIPESHQLQWWVIAVAIAGGCSLLLLLSVGLWRCGFFNRKKYDDQEDLANSDNNSDSPSSTSKNKDYKAIPDEAF